VVLFSHIVQIKKECIPNLSKNSVSAGTLIANNLPMQHLQLSYEDSIAFIKLPYY